MILVDAPDDLMILVDAPDDLMISLDARCSRFGMLYKRLCFAA